MILFQVGNGQHIFLWHDNWLSGYGPRSAMLFGLHLGIKLAAVIDGVEWKWPHVRSNDMVEI